MLRGLHQRYSFQLNELHSVLYAMPNVARQRLVGYWMQKSLLWHLKHLVMPPLCCRQTWRHSSFRQRALLLKTLVKYIVENQDTICR